MFFVDTLGNLSPPLSAYALGVTVIPGNNSSGTAIFLRVAGFYTSHGTVPGEEAAAVDTPPI